MDLESEKEPFLGYSIFHYGIMRVRRIDDRMMTDRINRILTTDIDEWNVYARYGHEDGIDACDYTFVFWYLKSGKNIVLYNPENMEAFSPETMISHIDISSVPCGKTPRYDYHTVNRDVMYHFIDTECCAKNHDTDILLMMGHDEQIAGMGVLPNSPITVKELMSCIGNLPMATSIHDYDDAVSAISGKDGKGRDTGIQNLARPLEIITSYKPYINRAKTIWTGTRFSEEYSVHGDNSVLMYWLYCRSTVNDGKYIGIIDQPCDNSTFGLAILIRSKSEQ